MSQNNLILLIGVNIIESFARRKKRFQLLFRVISGKLGNMFSDLSTSYIFQKIVTNIYISDQKLNHRFRMFFKAHFPR